MNAIRNPVKIYGIAISGQGQPSMIFVSGVKAGDQVLMGFARSYQTGHAAYTITPGVEIAAFAPQDNYIQELDNNNPLGHAEIMLLMARNAQ